MTEAPQRDRPPATDYVVPSISKADQAAWEAPALRPTFTRYHERETWAHPCPEWCTGDGPGQDVARLARVAREHQGHSLRVRQDSAYSYHDETETGMHNGHLDVSLVAASRDLTPKVQIVVHHGRSVDGISGYESTHKLVPMYPDEVRELIAVLQHQLKVDGC